MKNANHRIHSAHRRLPALVAMGGTLAVIPAAALELGDVSVQSRLGEPLRASIAYALAPHEQIANSCVSLRQGSSASGLPGIGSATLSVSNGVIMLAGKSVIREPMVSAHIVIKCPYSPNLSREYMLFIDPATPAYEAITTTQQVSAEAAPLALTPAATRPASKPAVRKDIGPASSYRVKAGDSLSEIVSRIQDRKIGLWPAVNAIFEANPHAFMNSDPNQLKAGSLLAIPSFNGSAAVVTAATPKLPQSITTDTVLETESVAENYKSSLAAATANTAASVANSDTSVAPDVTTSELKPGDIVLDDNPFVEPLATRGTVTIPDTQLEAPTTSSATSNVPTAIIRTSDNANSGSASPSWILWLAGSGVALIIGLLMFGRRFRGEPDATPLEPAIEETFNRRISDKISDTENLEAIGVNYDLTDESPTDENLVLDADLIIGTGLTSTGESNISEDFGFAASSKLDIELPFEPEAAATEATDILGPLRAGEETILMSEVLPDDDDYDMSVIIDATKMPMPEDVTERDLHAVVVESDGEDTALTDGYTINREIDYDVLEQDYEDEFTATQALNIEISRAADELASRMEVEAVDVEETTAMPLASVTELDITAQMPAQNDDVSGLDDAGITQEITTNEAADDSTVEMPAEKSKAR